MLTHFKPSGFNRWDIRVDGSKRGRIEIEKRGARGLFVAVLTRQVPNAAKDGICAFVGALNG